MSDNMQVTPDDPGSPPPLYTPPASPGPLSSRSPSPCSEARPRSPVQAPSGAEVIELAGRDEQLPAFYRINSHPQLEHVHNVRNIYVYIQDTDPSAARKFLDFIKAMVLPDGTQAAIEAAGYLEFEVGDYVFACDKWGSGLSKDDVIQAWVTPEGVITPAMYANIEAVRDEALGDADNRTPDKPNDVDGQFTGGTGWERHKQAVAIGNSERAYALAQTFQIQKNLTGPSVGAKVKDGNPSEHNELRFKTIQAASPVAIASLESGPKEVAEALRLQAEVTNLPRVGHEGNYAFPTMQLNISSTKSADSIAASSFKKEIGQFAGKHVDRHDSPGGYTCMIAMNDLAPGEEPGYFMIAELGIAIRLKGLVTTCFCGLRYHGGFPPTAPPGIEPAEWSYRFVVVCYPSSPIIDGSSLVAFGALSKGELLAITPEMKDPSYDNVRATTNCASWISDGPWLTTRQAYLDFVYRASGELLYYLTNQVPSQLKFQLDFDLLRQAMSIEDENGQRIQPSTWDLHPGSTHTSEQFGCSRAQSVRRWDLHKQKHAQFYPYVLNKQNAKKKGTHGPTNHDAQEQQRPRRTSSRKRKAVDAVADEEHGSEPENEEEPSLSDSAVRRSKRLKGNTTADRTASSSLSSQSQHSSVGQAANVAMHRYPLRSSTPDSFTELSNKQIVDVAASFQDEAEVHVDMLDKIMQHASSSSVNECTSVPMAADNEDFSPTLQLFSVPYLTQQLAILNELVNKISQMAPFSVDDTSVHAFVQGLDTTKVESVKFAYGVAALWNAWPQRALALELTDLSLAQERRILMISNTAAWRWLTQDCVRHATSIVTTLQATPTAFNSTSDWLTELTRDVFHMWRQRNHGELHASQYLPGLNVSAHAIIYLPRFTARVSPAEVPEFITTQVVKIVRAWLAFPSNTQLLAAYFVMNTIAIVQNTDILLLQDMWRIHQNIKSRLLRQKRTRHRSLTLSMLSPFLSVLRQSPVSDPLGPEAALLAQISDAIARCNPGLEEFSKAVATYFDMARGCPVLPSLPILTPYKASKQSQPHSSSKAPTSRPVLTTSESRPPSKAPPSSVRVLHARAVSSTATSHPSTSPSSSPLPPAIASQASNSSNAPGHSPSLSHVLHPLPALPVYQPQVVAQDRLDQLLAFVRELIPFVHDDPFEPQSPMQKLVATDIDHFLPFREHSPSRCIVKGVGGPFHASLARAQGVFASQAISRALLFNSQALHRGLTKGYFSNLAQWTEFLTDNGFNGTTQSIAWLVNLACYGTPQNQRLAFLVNPEVYFARDVNWKQFCSGEESVSFEQTFTWLQSRGKFADKTGELKVMRMLPLFGKLTSYLLAADLVYTGRVKQPSVQDVGTIVHTNNLGSKACLDALMARSNSSTTLQDTLSAFEDVFNFLNASLTLTEKNAITFDAIMVEHLLCKFQRVSRRLAGK